MAKEKQVELSTNERISSFISRNRLILIIVAAVLVVGIVVAWITVSSLESRLENKIEAVEVYQERFSELAMNLDELSEEELSTAWTQYTEELQDFIGTTKNNYPELRAMFLLASASYQIDDYSAAAGMFAEIAEKYPDSHLAATSLMNAAAAYEQAGSIDDALDMYTALTEDYAERSFEVPHAYFNIGRLFEQQGAVEEAVTVYRELSIDYPSSEWSNLAISRLIVLEQ